MNTLVEKSKFRPHIDCSSHALHSDLTHFLMRYILITFANIYLYKPKNNIYTTQKSNVLIYVAQIEIHFVYRLYTFFKRWIFVYFYKKKSGKRLNCQNANLYITSRGVSYIVIVDAIINPKTLLRLEISPADSRFFMFIVSIVVASTIWFRSSVFVFLFIAQTGTVCKMILVGIYLVSFGACWILLSFCSMW